MRDSYRWSQVEVVRVEGRFVELVVHSSRWYNWYRMTLAAQGVIYLRDGAYLL